jgi:hypothetical protein
VDAGGLLDKYPWFSLHPVDLHPEFFTGVLSEVTKRDTERAGGNSVAWERLGNLQEPAEETAKALDSPCTAMSLVQLPGEFTLCAS